MVIEHLHGVDPVYVVGSEYKYEIGTLVVDEVQVLEQGVGRSQEPTWAPTHLSPAQT